MYKVGQKPGIGTYQCTSCQHKVRLVKDDARLPFCTRCGHGKRVWYRRLH